MPEAPRQRDAVERSLKIARRIAKREDADARRRIEAFAVDLDYRRREDLAIAEPAWAKVLAAGVPPRLAFAHPDLLRAIPNASLHYRGMALLSRKRVQELAGSVDAWERSPGTARVAAPKALNVSRLYNAVISAILLDQTEWTFEDAVRNVLATVGMTEDGAMRNVIGQEAEQRIKERLLDSVRTRGLLASSAVQSGPVWELEGGVLMRFGSEPDIAFERRGKFAVVIEIKGGKDPAGALERLGAVKKTFEEAPAGCKNFLIAGVVTPTMRTRLEEMRMERDFDIDALLSEDDAWDGFMDEVFHHALRIV